MKKQIICLTGEIGAGKTTAALFLEKLGYKYISFVDVIKKHYDNDKLFSTVTRNDVINFANDLRQTNSTDFFVYSLLSDPNFLASEKIVIDGVRYLSEYTLLKSLPLTKCYLVGIISSFENRLKRVLLRKKISDPKTEYEFVLNETLEADDDFNEKAQEVRKCLLKSDFIIENNSTLVEYNKNVQLRLNFILLDNSVL